MDSDEIYRGRHSQVVDTGLVGIVNQLLHRSLERNLPKRPSSSRHEIIELGSGMGQHLSFVQDDFTKYVQTDIRIENISLSKDSRIERRRVDAQDLSSFDSNSFDRLLATCLLVHLSDPEKALREWKRVVRDGGTISIYVPCEPGLLLRAMRYMTTRRKGNHLGFNHLSFHYREHVTYFVRLSLLLREVFSDCQVKRRFFPFPFFPSWNFNLWCTYQIRLDQPSIKSSKER